MKKQEVARVCFQILGRHFPGSSGNDSKELRKILNISEDVNSSPDLNSRTSDAAAWKAAATNWLAENISFKRGN